MSVVRSVLFALTLGSIPFSPLALLDARADQQHTDHIGISRSALVDAVRRATESFRDARFKDDTARLVGVEFRGQ